MVVMVVVMVIVLLVMIFSGDGGSGDDDGGGDSVVGGDDGGDHNINFNYKIQTIYVSAMSLIQATKDKNLEASGSALWCCAFGCATTYPNTSPSHIPPPPHPTSTWAGGGDLLSHHR